jgi:hypothetical protein
MFNQMSIFAGTARAKRYLCLITNLQEASSFCAVAIPQLNRKDE